MNARNKEHEGDQQCAYAVHINNNTITKESQSPIREVLARSCWRVGLGQEAFDGSKVTRKGKAGPFIPCEVRAQIGPTRATTLAVAHRCRRATTSVGARVNASPLGRQRLRPGENFCVHAATHALGRRRLPHARGVFLQTPPTSAFERQRLRPSDNVCRVRL